MTTLLKLEEVVARFLSHVGVGSNLDVGKYLKHIAEFTPKKTQDVQYALVSLAIEWAYSELNTTSDFDGTDAESFIVPEEVSLYIQTENLEKLLKMHTKKGLCLALEYIYWLRETTVTFYIGSKKGKPALRYRCWTGNQHGGVDCRRYYFPTKAPLKAID